MDQLLDITLLAAIAGFGLYGFAVGFVQALTSLVGLVFSIFVASRVQAPLTEWLFPASVSDQFALQLLIFFLVLLLVTSLVHVLLKVVDRVFHIIAIIPFTKTLNRLLGTLFGLLVGVISVAAILLASLQLPGLPTAFQEALAHSSIVRWVLILSGVVALLFPTVIEQAREIVGSS